MGCTKKENNSIFSNLELSKIGDNNTINGNVLFCHNGKSIIIIFGSSCELYNVATGEQVKTLFTCESKIVCCHFHPCSKEMVIALSEEGELVKYDIESDILRRRRKLKFDARFLTKQKVYKFDEKKSFEWDNEILNDVKKRKFVYGMPLIVANFYKMLYWTSWSLNDESQCHVAVFQSNGVQLEKVALPKLPLAKCYKNFGVFKTSDKDVVYVGMGINRIDIYHYSQGGLKKCSHSVHSLGAEVELTCLTLFPKELSFATADSRGIVFIWKDILRSLPIRTSYLWHTVKINDIAFSDEGAHFYSGGNENVLVKWSVLANQKTFLPRLPSPILHISVAEAHSLLAVSLAHNEIYIIDPNLQKISVIKKFSLHELPNVKRSYHYLLTTDPRSDNLVLKGTVGHLEFISSHNNLNPVYSLDVGRVNYMTGERKLINLNVTHAKFNESGSLMVTAEERKDKLLREFRLKFWHYNDLKQCFILNTSMELPHDENEIHSLEISSDDVVATSGSDKKFKMWTQFEVNTLNVTKMVWSVFSVGRYKSLPAGPIDFCHDATLIAVGFGPSLTLWDTNTGTLKCSLVAPFKRDHLKFVKFGKEEHSHLVVTATEYNIKTWNVITLTVCWTVDLDVSYLVGDFYHSYMCVFSKKGTLFLFSPGSTSPELIMENVSESEVVVAHSAFNVNNVNNPFQLYFINSKGEMFCLKAKEQSKEEEMNDAIEVHATPFSAQIAQKTGGSVKKSVSEYVPTKSRKDSHYMSSILDAPAHSLQNPLRFCSDFLASLTTTKDKSSRSSDIKGSETSKAGDVIKINDSNDNDEVIEIIDSMDYEMSENLLWATVNGLFK